MARIDLQVPFADKDEAKRLGARWNGRARTWYIPEGLEPSAFKKWLPEPPAPNVRATGWFLASSTRACWRCGALSRVFAIVLPAGYEALMIEDDSADDHWQHSERRSLLSYVVSVPPSVAAQLRRLAPRYRVDYSQTTHDFYRMNHCEHCEAKLGDFETIEETGTFDQPGVGLLEINEPFEGWCGSHTM